VGERATYRRFDWFVPACVAILVTYGVLFVGSARGAASDRAMKQLLWTGFGVAAFLAAVYVDYMTLLRHAYSLYAVGIAALFLVLFTRPINNARSWFDLGFFKVQPSEFVKLIWVLAVARLLVSHENYKRLSGLWPPLVLTFLPLALVLKQPDLGTAMLFVPALFAMLYAAGARPRHLALMGGSGVAGAGVLWAAFMRGYQKRRILAWLNPEEYSATEAYQMLTAKTAIGSGGFFGKGLGRGTLNQLAYVPENDTDLIFSGVAEEWGFIGCTALIIVFALMTVSCFAIARRVREPQGRLVAIGLTALLAFQTVVNLWVAVGLLPTTGVTLPFVSYGGSSMISSFAAVGLIVNVGMRRHATLARDPFS
jgi:rod shape determining protein RodA